MPVKIWWWFWWWYLHWHGLWNALTCSFRCHTKPPRGISLLLLWPNYHEINSGIIIVQKLANCLKTGTSNAISMHPFASLQNRMLWTHSVHLTFLTALITVLTQFGDVWIWLFIVGWHFVKGLDERKVWCKKRRKFDLTCMCCRLGFPATFPAMI